MTVECSALSWTFISPLVRFKENLERRGKKECNSQKIRRKNSKCCLQSLVTPLQALFHSGCGTLPWTCTSLSLSTANYGSESVSRDANPPSWTISIWWILKKELLCLLRVPNSNPTRLQWRIPNPWPHWPIVLTTQKAKSKGSQV